MWQQDRVTFACGHSTTNGVDGNGGTKIHRRGGAEAGIILQLDVRTNESEEDKDITTCHFKSQHALHMLHVSKVT